MNDDLVAESHGVMLAERLTPKQDALQTPILISQTEVDVPGRRAAQIADFAFKPEIMIKRV